MILPSPVSFREFKRFPLASTLVGLNLFIFILIFSGNYSSLAKSSLLQEKGLTLSGRLYYQYMTEDSKENLGKASSAQPEWVAKMQPGNSEQMGVLGAYALRDADFLNVAEKISYRGDDVQITIWKKNLHSFREEYQEQLLFRFGLSSIEKGPLSWVTYQFSHSSWLHLFSNLIFLAVISMAVEMLAGSGTLLVVYLLGGIAGGFGFLLSQGPGTVPMVGASASISALLAFYCVAEVRSRIRYFYFVSPMPGHHGFIYLPTLLIIPLFLLVDLANLWSTPEGLGSGVAYAAHLGGTVFGLIAGFAYRLSTKPATVATKY